MQPTLCSPAVEHSSAPYRAPECPRAAGSAKAQAVLRASLADVHKCLSRLAEENASLEHNLAEARAEVLRLQGELRECAQSKEALDETREALQTSYQEELAAKEEAQLAERAQLRAQVLKLQGEIQDMQAACCEVMRGSEETKAALLVEQERQEAAVARAEVGRLEAELELLRSEILTESQGITAVFARLQTSIDTLQTSRHQLQYEDGTLDVIAAAHGVSLASPLSDNGDTCQHAARDSRDSRQGSNQAPGFLPFGSGQEADDAVTLVRCEQGESNPLDSRVADDVGWRLLAAVEQVAVIENTLQSALAAVRTSADSCNASEAASSTGSAPRIFPATTFSQRAQLGKGDDAGRLRDAAKGANDLSAERWEGVSGFSPSLLSAAEPLRSSGAEQVGAGCGPTVSDSVPSELAMQEATRWFMEAVMQAEAVVHQLETSVLTLASQKQAAEDECGSLSMQQQQDKETIARLQLLLREGDESCILGTHVAEGEVCRRLQGAARAEPLAAHPQPKIAAHRGLLRADGEKEEEEEEEEEEETRNHENVHLSPSLPQMKRCCHLPGTGADASSAGTNPLDISLSIQQDEQHTPVATHQDPGSGAGGLVSKHLASGEEGGKRHGPSLPPARVTAERTREG